MNFCLAVLSDGPSSANGLFDSDFDVSDMPPLVEESDDEEDDMPPLVEESDDEEDESTSEYTGDAINVNITGTHLDDRYGTAVDTGAGRHMGYDPKSFQELKPLDPTSAPKVKVATGKFVQALGVGNMVITTTCIKPDGSYVPVKLSFRDALLVPK